VFVAFFIFFGSGGGGVCGGGCGGGGCGGCGGGGRSSRSVEFGLLEIANGQKFICQNFL